MNENQIDDFYLIESSENPLEEYSEESWQYIFAMLDDMEQE